MPLDTAQLTALLTALTGLVAAISAGAARRQSRIQREQREQKKAQREMQRVVNAALGHIFAIEQRLAARGITPPRRPSELEQFYDDPDDDEDGHAPDTPARDQPSDDPDRGDPAAAPTRRRRHGRPG